MMMIKPVSSLAMGFGGDPYEGMQTLKFAGAAVTFLPTVTSAPAAAAAGEPCDSERYCAVRELYRLAARSRRISSAISIPSACRYVSRIASCSLRSSTSCLRSRTTVPQRLDVEAVALGLRIDVADVVGERLLLLLQPLDALDERLEVILGETVAAASSLTAAAVAIGHS